MQDEGKNNPELGEAKVDHGEISRKSEKTKSARSTTGSARAAAAAARTGVRKSIDKGRVLQRRDSGGSDGHKWDLTDEFDMAEDRELMTDEEHNGAVAAASCANQVPSADDQFWTRMAGMFDHKLDTKIGAFYQGPLHGAEHGRVELGNHNPEGGGDHARRDAGHEHPHRRCHGLLGAARDEGKQRRDGGSDAGRREMAPGHIILGGWPERTTRETVKKES